MLETIREFGWEVLVNLGESDDVQRAHASWCLSLAETAAPELRRVNRFAWHARLDADHANLRRALTWAIEQADAEAAVRMVAALWIFWETRGYLAEGRAWADRALALPGEVDPRLRAAALYGAAVLPYRQGDYDRALVLCEECLRLWREIGDLAGIASALNGLGIVVFDRGDFDRAAACYDEAIALRRVLGDRRALSAPLNNLGVLLYEQGDYARSRSVHEETYALWRDADDPFELAFALNGLGRAIHRLGDLATAATYLEQAVALRRDHDTGGLAASLNNLAALVRDQGDLPRAVSLFQESLALRWTRGEKRGVAEAMAGLAEIIASHEPRTAARLFGAVDGLRESSGIRIPPPEQRIYDRALDSLASVLGRRQFEQELAAGREMPLAMAVDQAVAFSLPVAATPAAPDVAAATLGLTPREVEVLRSLASGKSDREVAEALSMSVATARRHVANIFLKLGVNSRTVAARIAFDRGIVER
jgi:DNA-binding CsgD family transcriptional regulator/tetratricopeptide (TPR) repeat protein